MSYVDYSFIATTSGGTELADFVNAKDRVWSRYLSKTGEARFRIKQKDRLAQDSFIKPGSVHLKIKRKGTLVWGGIIDAITENIYDIEVHASTYEALLGYQVTGYEDTYTSAECSGVIKTLWDTAKATGNSLLANFTSGAIESPYISATFPRFITVTFDYEPLLSVFQKMTNLGKADWSTSAQATDFYITPQKEFNFLKNVGTQKDNITYVLGGQVRDFTYFLDARTIRNRVVGVGVGTGAALLTDIETDAPSQTAYGLMEEAVPFKDLESTSALQPTTQEWLKSWKDPSEVVQFTLKPGIAPLIDYQLGDRIKVDIERGHTNIKDTFYRVVGVQVAMTNEGAEVVRPILNKVRT